MEILNITSEDGVRIIYTSSTSLIGLSQDEFTRVVTEAKRLISRRPYILDRFEHWELPNASKRNVRALLLSRAKDEKEKQIVEHYASTWE